jgi:hypothetical protein
VIEVFYFLIFSHPLSRNFSCSLGKISVFKNELLNNKIGDEVLGWFE